MNREHFFKSVRASFGAMNQSQVDGYNFLLDAIEANNISIKHAAYMLATAWHETAITMQPIGEYGKGHGRKYGTWRRNSRGVQYAPMSGGKNAAVYLKSEYAHLYFGRGYVQLTWFNNYKLMGEILGIDLLNNPDLAMRADIAANIMIVGMVRGLFTGKKLNDYINDKKTDYVNARRIINGTDAAAKIASHAVKYERALIV